MTYAGKPRALTQRQKRIIAGELIQCAGTLIEFWEERFDNDPPCTADEAAHQVATWLKRLPGDAWDNRLPQPEGVR